MKPKYNISNREMKTRRITMAIKVQRAYQNLGAALTTRWNSVLDVVNESEGQTRGVSEER
jgi:hypothetical protein